MRNAFIITQLCFSSIVLSGCTAWTYSEAVSIDQPTSFNPIAQNIEGWTVYVDPKLLDKDNAEEDTAALEMLANHLQRINVLFSQSDTLEAMHRLELWIEQDHDIDVEPGPYHPGEEWLIERGYDPRLAKKVHVTRAGSLLDRHQMLKHPMVILHELSHAYHHQVLGFDEPRIIAAYQRAMDKRLYQQVQNHNGKQVKAYATTNEMEYFAEGVEAYFYRNDFFPFVRAELKEYDPDLHQLLEDIFGSLED